MLHDTDYGLGSRVNQLNGRRQLCSRGSQGHGYGPISGILLASPESRPLESDELFCC